MRFVVLIALLLPLAARAEPPATQPYPGMRYWHESRSNPAMSLYVVQVDLRDPNISVRVSPAGKDPDGDGEWQTVLEPPSKIARREQFDVCINASFFKARSTQDDGGALTGT